MEGFQAWDRHNPLPHITLSTTAPKSVYRKTSPMAAHLATELRERQVLVRLEWQHFQVAEMHFPVQPDWPRCVIA